MFVLRTFAARSQSGDVRNTNICQGRNRVDDCSGDLARRGNEITLPLPLPMNRRSFVTSALASGAALLGGASLLKAQSAPAPAANPRFKLGYGPHPGMFKDTAGADVLDQIRFAADQGFTAWEDNGMMGRPPAEQEAIGRLLGEKGMQMGVFVAYANFDEPTFAKPDEATTKEILQRIQDSVAVAQR